MQHFPWRSRECVHDQPVGYVSTVLCPNPTVVRFHTLQVHGHLSLLLQYFKPSLFTSPQGISEVTPTQYLPFPVNNNLTSKGRLFKHTETKLSTVLTDRSVFLTMGNRETEKTEANRRRRKQQLQLANNPKNRTTDSMISYSSMSDEAAEQRLDITFDTLER